MQDFNLLSKDLYFPLLKNVLVKVTKFTVKGKFI